jgi:hypothetical protein
MRFLCTDDRFERAAPSGIGASSEKPLSVSDSGTFPPPRDISPTRRQSASARRRKTTRKTQRDRQKRCSQAPSFMIHGGQRFTTLLTSFFPPRPGRPHNVYLDRRHFGSIHPVRALI